MASQKHLPLTGNEFGWQCMDELARDEKAVSAQKPASQWTPLENCAPVVIRAYTVRNLNSIASTTVEAESYEQSAQIGVLMFVQQGQMYIKANRMYVEVTVECPPGTTDFGQLRSQAFAVNVTVGDIITLPSGESVAPLTAAVDTYPNCNEKGHGYVVVQTGRNQ